MRRKKQPSFMLVILFIPSLVATAMADTLPAVSPASDATHLELIISARAPALPPEDIKKKHDADFDPATDMQDKAWQAAVKRAVILSMQVSDQYPKCNLHIASLVPEDEKPLGEHAPPPDPNLVHVRVSLIGNPGCLTTAK